MGEREREREAHLEGGLAAQGGRGAEPAGGAGVVGVPGLVDHAPAGGPGVLLAHAVEAVGGLGVHAQAEVVPEQAAHLRGSAEGMLGGLALETQTRDWG